MKESTSLHHDLATLQSASVRSLAWAIASAPLMDAQPGLDIIDSEMCRAEYAYAREWLISLDSNPRLLLEHLAKTSTRRVGYHFEALINFWLNWHPGYEFLATNLQVQEDKRTLGAFDYILRNKDGEIEHWEAAVKFYLQYENDSNWSSWIGPGKRDRLDLKLTRMISHQLPLSATKAGIAALEQLGANPVRQRRALIKGMFFRPWRAHGVGPKGRNLNAPMGVWVAKRDLGDYALTYPDSRWTIREKPDWMSPSLARVEQSLSREELSALKIFRPRLLSRLEALSEDLFFECERLFIVPDDWRIS
jgi:uncharacterized protein